MSWQTVTIEKIKADVPYACVGGPFGSELTTRDYVEEGVPVIRGSNLPMDRSFVDDNFVFVSEQKANALTSNIAHPGDVIFTQRGTLGQVGLIPEDATFDRYVVSQSQMKLTVDKAKASPLFVYYYFRQPAVAGMIKGRAITSGVPHINLGILKNFELVMPPVQDQLRIARFLAEIDRAIENNRRRIQLLEQSARLLYKEWFVHLRFPGHEHVKVVDGVPKGWQRLPLTQVCESIGGGTPSTAVAEYWDGDITWVTPSDVTKSSSLYLLDSEKKITEAGLRNSSAKMLPPEAILMTSRASIGFFAVMNRTVCTNQGFIAVVPKVEHSRSFLLFHLMSRVEEFRSRASGSTFKELSKGKFRELSVIWPDRSIYREFEDHTAPILAHIQSLAIMNAKLVQARDLLLPRLMSGEIEV